VNCLLALLSVREGLMFYGGISEIDRWRSRARRTRDTGSCCCPYHFRTQQPPAGYRWRTEDGGRLARAAGLLADDTGAEFMTRRRRAAAHQSVLGLFATFLLPPSPVPPAPLL
jgi:hypothetical protein